MPDHSHTIRTRAATALPPQLWTGLLIATGFLFLYQSSERVLEIVVGAEITFLTAVGIVYTSIGGVIFLSLRYMKGKHPFSIWVRLTVVGWAIILVSIITGVMVIRLGYEQAALPLIKSSVGEAIMVFCKLLPTSTLFLLGVAQEPRARRKARVAVVGSFVLASFLLLLQWYQGFEWPIFGFVAVGLLTTLTLIFGTPLYLLGLSIRLQDVMNSDR